MNFKEKISKESYQALKAENKAYAERSKYLRIAAQNNRGDVRYRLRDMKRNYAEYNRARHLALAFFRGRTHEQCESNADYQPRKRVLELVRFYATPKYAKEELEKDLALFWGDSLPETIKELAEEPARPAPQKEGLFSKILNTAVGHVLATK